MTDETIDPFEDLTTTMGEVYEMKNSYAELWEGKKKTKKEPGFDGLKQQFKDAAVEHNASKPLKRMTASYLGREEDIDAWVAKKHPLYSVKDVVPDPDKDDLFRLILEERPEYKPFQYVNQEDGLVWSIQIVSGTPQADEDEIEADDPDFWKAISYVPEPRRQMKPLSDLTKQQLAKLQKKYLYAGPPQVKVAAPREAKPEDLEEPYEG